MPFGDHRIEVLEAPGDTRGHVVYFVPEAEAAFVGDTLFAMGCGRLFESESGVELRPDSLALRARLGLDGADAVSVFARTRALKDEFRG